MLQQALEGDEVRIVGFLRRRDSARGGNEALCLANGKALSFYDGAELLYPLLRHGPEKGSGVAFGYAALPEALLS